jgi:hypothetical protein
MSSNRPFAKKEIDITKDSVTHDQTHITKKSSIKIGRTDTATIKIGLRIKTGQTIDAFEIKPAGSPTAITLTLIQEPDSRYDDLETVLPSGADEKWVIYTAPWNANHGKKFVTSLKVGNTSIHPNGFQVVTTVATADSVSFANGHYIFGLSILPGATNEGEPYFLGSSGGSTATSAKSTKAKAKKAPKKKGKKKSK